jgi:formylglycine-generating enzyme required for sulfatase activity
MTGNLCEWVVDQYDKVTRFVKGGSWADDAVNSVISESEKFPAKFKSDRIGFRVCQDE